jgi:hypothetical protein
MLSAEFFPNPDQDDLLRATLERVNRASDMIGKAAFAGGVRPGSKLIEELRAYAGPVIEKFGLASPYPSLIVSRVADEMRAAPNKPPRFRDRQSIGFTAAQLKWAGPDKVGFPTWKGKRNLRVALDSKGPVPLRAPLEGHAVALVERNGKLYLDATDLPPEPEDETTYQW